MCSPGKCVWLYTLVAASLYFTCSHAVEQKPSGQLDLSDVMLSDDSSFDANKRNSFWKREAGFWKRSDDAALAQLEENQVQDELEKRAKYFLGKKAKYFLGKRGGNRNMFLGKRDDYLDGEDFDEDKRARMAFLGKRARTHFLGKRGRTHFLGKRDPDMAYGDDMELEDESEKRAKYFLG